jgi:hypothetical protein
LRILLVLLILVTLIACQSTTQEKTAGTTTKPTDAATKKYNLGYIVSYNELCAQFRGTGADDRILQELKRKFANDRNFELGYDQLSSYRVYDNLTGLHQCPEMRELLDNVYKTYVESLGQKT